MRRDVRIHRCRFCDTAMLVPRDYTGLISCSACMQVTAVTAEQTPTRAGELVDTTAS